MKLGYESFVYGAALCFSLIVTSARPRQSLAALVLAAST